jgi:cytochrome c-type biogenesis protein CcmF
VRGHLAVTRDGRALTDMYPEKRVYRVQRNPMTEAPIHSRIQGDLYVQMGEVIQGQSWLVRIWVKPFVSWIWAGCLLMGLGGVLAVTDRRYRSRSTASSRASAAAADMAPGQAT